MNKAKNELHDLQKQIELWAKGYGLDFFETIFELIDAKHLNEIAAYGGFPTRYPHWRFGMIYDSLSKGYEYGLQKIYELVINNDPCYAYLMNSNTLDEMANHASRIRQYGELYGIDEVENFIDLCLSLENLIDVHTPSRKGHDILEFLIQKAPLEEWQRETLIMLRDEAYYFLPQGQTKIMNEGWASFWHSKILTEKALQDIDIVDFADHHSATLATQPGQINPYKLGIEIYRDIEERWNTGRFGKEYEECDDIEFKRHWDKKLGKGLEKIFQVRKLYNDVTFIDEFLTPELCEKLKLFVYAYNKRNGTYEIVDRDTRKVKDKLLFSLTNFGQPMISVTEDNFEGKGVLLLTHTHYGVDLKLLEAKETLERVQKIWKQTVCLETIINGERRLLIYDGKEHREKSL
ncbi:MAG: SpoVR family protein [Deltaproteobacteria bacterium]|nr:SpoVR family protein [Deltaproteobacteria bacterium]